MTRTVTHPEFQNDYDAGFYAMQEFIASAGIEVAKRKFNAENPSDQDFSSLGSYYYAAGEIDALVS